MRVLVVGRTIPEAATGMMGLFEIGQAYSLQRSGQLEICYGFVDTRSIKVFRKIRKFDQKMDGLAVYGYFLPIGGLYKKIYDQINFYLFRRLYDRIEEKEGKIDLVHIHFPLITVNSLILSFLKEKKVAIICTEHWTKIVRKLLTQREQQILLDVCRYARKVIAVSDDLRQSILDYCPDFSHKVVTIPNIVDDTYAYIPRVQDETFTFLTVGRLAAIKNNLAVLRAFKKFSAENEQARLYIVGDGVEARKLQAFTAANQLEEKVIFPGFLSPTEIHQLFSQVDVYLSASEMETFGLPLVEGWLSGRPGIVRKTHALRQYVNEKNGLLFSADDDLAPAMQKSFVRNYDGKKISQSARSFFSEEAVVQQLLTLYEEALS